MAWNGNEFEKPLVLLKHEYLSDATELNAYKLDEDLEDLAKGEPSSESFIGKLAKAEKIKEACDFLAYTINPRAGLWWAYLCVKEFRDDLKKAKEEKEKLGDEYEQLKGRFAQEKEQFKKTVAEGKKKTEDFQKQLDDWSQELVDGKINDPRNPLKGFLEDFKEENSLKEAEEAIKQIEEMKRQLPPEIVKAAEAEAAEVEKAFMAEFGGKSIRKFLKDGFMKAAFPPTPDLGPNKLDIEEAKLKEKIEDIKKEIKDQLSIFPLKIPGLPKPPSKKKIGAALEAGLRWTLAPTETNAKKALDSGNELTDKPEGMLAMSAFWAGNNLNPESKDAVIIKSPPGLASRGISSTIFLCAINQDIKHKDFDQRYKEYYNFGIEVAQGVNTWGEPFETTDPLEHINREKKVPAPAPAPRVDDNKWAGKSGFGRWWGEEVKPVEQVDKQKKEKADASAQSGSVSTQDDQSWMGRAGFGRWWGGDAKHLEQDDNGKNTSAPSSFADQDERDWEGKSGFGRID